MLKSQPVYDLPSPFKSHCMSQNDDNLYDYNQNRWRNSREMKEDWRKTITKRSEKMISILIPCVVLARFLFFPKLSRGREQRRIRYDLV